MRHLHDNAEERKMQMSYGSDIKSIRCFVEKVFKL